MKKLIALFGLGFALAVSAPVFAGAQQEKMKGCSAEAKDAGLKGGEYKAFISKCLKKDYVLKVNEAAPAAKSAPLVAQDKRKSCSADAKTRGLKGDERKSFISTCLKG